MRNIKCKYCGKIYASPSEMRKRKCHSHPNGAWGGYCTPDSLDESEWKSEKFYDSVIKDCENFRKNTQKRKMHEAEFMREYKKHTPLLDCMLGMNFADELDESKLQIRESDLNQLALDLANGINEESPDAINTIYALRAGCDYVLDNTDAQKEGKLDQWLDDVKSLKDEVLDWEFWVALYYLTRPIKDCKTQDEKDFENSSWGDGDYDTKKKKMMYWVSHSIANEFHVKQVIPMLHAVNKKGDEKEREVMRTITSYVREMKSKEKGFRRIFATLCKRINNYSFWGVLYCLYWMKLHPTPWNDQKVWPIQDAKESAQAFDPESFCALRHLRTFREQTLGMSKIGNSWAINLHKYFNPTFHVRVQKGRISWETGCRSSLHFRFLKYGIA